MTQWRDEPPAGSGSIEELGSVARPARVGSSRSALIPALIVGALLVGVVALGMSGRSQDQRTAAPPPVSAVDASPRAPEDSPAPARSPDVIDPPPPDPPRGGPGPTPSLSDNPLLQDDVLFWVELVDDEGPLVRGYLAPGEEHRVSMTITGARSDTVRVRLFGRIGDRATVRLTNVAIPDTSGQTLERPLLLDRRTLTAEEWPVEYRTDPLTDLEYRLRLENGREDSRTVTVRVSVAP